MKKLLKNILLLTGCAVMLAGSGKLSAQAMDVKIDENHFPDATFRKFVLDQYDTNGNEILESSETADVTEMEIDPAAYKDCKNLTGILK